MKKYYLYDGVTQHGPFEFDELQSKNISPETAIWFDPMPDWKTAGEIEELHSLFEHQPPPFHGATGTIHAANGKMEASSVAVASVAATTTETIEEPKPTIKLESTASSPVAQPAVAARISKPPTRRNTGWISFVLSLLVLGGAGYFVYADVEKKSKTNISLVSDDTAKKPADENVNPVVASTPPPGSTTDTALIEPAALPPTTTTAVPTSNNKKKAEAEKKKLDEKKKQEELDKETARKKLEEKKNSEAAAAREKQIRNGWPNYITVGNLNYKPKNDGISAFEIPIQNNTDAMIDKVTVRIDYYKKEGKEKPMKSETIVVTNIPPRSLINGMAPENKRSKKVNVFITGIISKKLHFCYPLNNGNQADPYFCN